MHFGAQRLEALLVAHPEAMLLVDDQQPQPAGARIGVQQLVGGDEDVDLAALEIRQHRVGGAAPAEARQHLDAHRPVGEAVAEALRVLLGEQRGRHQHHHLAGGLHRDEGGAHRHFGLAEADIAADDAIHRHRPVKVGEHARDRFALVGGFLEGKAVGKGLVFELAGAQRRRLVRGAARVQVEQLRGHIAHGGGGAARGARPLLGAELVERGAFRAAAGVAVDQVQGVHRHVQAIAVAVFEHQEFAGVAADLHDLESLVTADAVFAVHHRSAGLEALQVAQDRRRIRRRAPPPPLLACARAKQLALGEQHELRIAQPETAQLRRHQDGEPGVAVDELAPVAELPRLAAMGASIWLITSRRPGESAASSTRPG